MNRPLLSLTALAAALATGGFSTVCAAQPAAAQAPVAPSPYSYADIADLATAAPMAIHGRVHKATSLKPESAPGVAAGQARLYVEVDVISLIRGSGPLASRIAYLVDLPLTAKGKPPKLKKKQPVLIFARPVTAGAPGSSATGSVRLIAPDAQLAWDPATEAMLRRILTEAVKPGAPPAIIGIANGYHVPGSLPGEGETQLFLETATGEPVSLTILRSPGAAPRWAAAFGEIVDDSAAVPAQGTLAWYRLSCGLPRTLPLAKLAGTAAEDRAKAVEDYRFVLSQLGNCPRTRTPPPAR